MKMISAEKAFPLNDYYSKIYKRYDFVNRLFTMGMDRKWRRETAEACALAEPSKVLDLCCGTGDLALRVKKELGNDIQVTGYDFNQSMLGIAHQKKEKGQIPNLDFLHGDAAKMPFTNSEFDCMTIGFGFRNLSYENPNQKLHLNEINRVLRNGGKLFILESSVPESKLIRFFYMLYLRIILIPLGGLISGNWKAYAYLASSSANYFNKEELTALLGNHGFKIINYISYFFGATNLIVAEKQHE